MNKKVNIGYHLPSVNTIYAQRTIYNGFKNAFKDLGNNFFTFTSGVKLENFLEDNQIDIFITCSHFSYQNQLDLKILKKYREKDLKLFTKVDFWDTPDIKLRINDARNLKYDKKTINLIKNNILGDVFFHVVEQGDNRMDGFEKGTGFKYYTIPLAADKIVLKGEFDNNFKADISYIGTYLPQKKVFFKNYVFPLKKKYKLKIYGQDWSFLERISGWVQRGGQYFNVPYIKSMEKPKLSLGDEAKIYKSSLISINVHEKYQIKFGGDCNERTFKILICEGFEITDDVTCISKYFKDGKEIIIAKNEREWLEKIDYYINNPEKRESIIKAGKEKVLKEHTYHNRVEQILRIYNNIR